jgi:hypothetical protein
MNAPHDFDDAAADALLSGGGREIDPELADLIGDVRVAYTSTPPVVGASLAALMGSSLAAADQPGRFERMRTSLLAKCGAAFAVALAATSGLAVAGALPPPIQNAMSHLGVGEPSSGGPQHVTTASESDTTTTTVTTVAGEVTTTTVVNTHPANHGGDVSAVAHDGTNEGCQHGHAVAAVASDGKSQGQPCRTTPTTLEGTTPTTEAGRPGNSDHSNGNQGQHTGAHNNGNQSNNANPHQTTPTTTAAIGGSHNGGGNGRSGPHN